MGKQFTTEEVKQIGNQIGISWEEVNINEFRRGLEVEFEHGSQWGEETNITNDDPIINGRIAGAHLKEIADYYTRLDKMEAEAEGK